MQTAWKDRIIKLKNHFWKCHFYKSDSEIVVEKPEQCWFFFISTIIISDSYNNFNERIIRDKMIVCKMISNQNHWIIRILKQIYECVEQIAFIPKHMNDGAYFILKRIHFAFELPFNLNFEKIGIYFVQFGIFRRDLMCVLQNNSEPNCFMLEAEDFDVDLIIYDIIITRASNSQKRFWNTSVTLSCINNVRRFVEKTVISYVDLQILFILKWMNFEDKLLIWHRNDSCDLNKKNTQFE